MKNIVIYGSYGYTGQLIAKIASGSGLPVVLSGRDEEKLQEQSEELGCPYLKASLSSDAEMDALLAEASLVIHCAGPFVNTWREMAKACIRNQCHYLDITGEIVVFESLKAFDRKFRDAGVMVMPGVGFDVVPTDCMAAYLHSLMPDATELELAFMGLGGGVSRGTAKTMVENLGSGGIVRRDGELKSVPAAFKTKKIDFSIKQSTAVSIPWGDISTAYTSTGIENITVYMTVPKGVIRAMKWSNFLAFLLKTDTAKKMFKKRIDKRPAGPDEKHRESGRSYIWGSVENDLGHYDEAVLETAEGYRLTAEMAWLVTEKVVHGEVKPGYQTPSSMFGWELIFEHPDTKWLKKSGKKD